jgi:hypothetical protein
MGFNNENGLPLVFDLETIAHEEAAAYLPPPDLDLLVPPKNYKLAETIANWKKEERLRRQKAYEDDLERCSLDPDLCRIVAIGAMTQRMTQPSVFLCKDEAEEKAALELFWDGVGMGMLIGFNVVEFDMPVLLRRSLLLGVRAPRMVISKYKHPRIIDMMVNLSFDRMTTYRKQSFYVKRFGLAGRVPEDCHDGSDIARLVHDGDWDAIAHHVSCDVLGCMALAEFTGTVGRTAVT